MGQALMGDGGLKLEELRNIHDCESSTSGYETCIEVGRAMCVAVAIGRTDNRKDSRQDRDYIYCRLHSDSEHASS